MANEDVDTPIFDPNARSSKDHGPSNYPKETSLPPAEEDEGSSESSNEDYEEAATPRKGERTPPHRPQFSACNDAFAEKPILQVVPKGKIVQEAGSTY